MAQPLRASLYLRTIVLLATLAAVPATAPGQAIRPGVAAPEIDLPALTGDRVRLSTLRGHPVVVTFWGTWCPPCREEFPALVAAQLQYRDSGLVVLGVNQRDQELSTRAVQEFASEFGVNFPVGLDARGRTRRNYRLIGLPTTIFIDRSGVIRTIHPGPIDGPAFRSALATILAAR